MNLLICIPSFAEGKGGAERVAAELGTAMHKRGHKIAFAYQKSLLPDTPQYPVPGDADLIKYDNSLCSLQRFRKRVLELSPDIILIFYFNWRVFELYDSLRDLNIPIAYRECSHPERVQSVNWTNASNAQQMRNEILASSHAICLLQTPYIESLRADIQHLVHIIPNPCVRASSPVAYGQSKTILHVGAAKSNKNADLMLDAFAMLLPDFPEWKLELCTTALPQYNPQYEKLKSRIETDFPAGTVMLRENVENMSQRYANATIHCITSMSEGLPNCVCEAMGQGRPSVGFAQSLGTNLLIQHGLNGLLASPGPQGLAEALASLMQNETLTSKLGHNAWKTALDFAPQTIYGQWEKFFTDAIGHSSQNARKSKPSQLANICTPWTEIKENTWLAYLINKINFLSGEIIFFGYGKHYERYKYLFKKLKPICVAVDRPTNKSEIDGIKIVPLDELKEIITSFPIAIFSSAAKIIEHRLRSMYDIQQEILCMDDRIGA